MAWRAIAFLLTWLGAVATATGATLEFNDPFAQRQWYLDTLRMNEAWNLIYQQPERGHVTVAVLDSGFDTSHVDLSENLLAGFNIVDGSGNIAPVNPHGTGTSAILGAQSGNGAGISQAAWTASVLPIRVSNRSDGAAYISHLAAGIRAAADSGARVINVSYSGIEQREIAKAAKYAYKRGAVLFMAAGNDGSRKSWSNSSYIVAVGSIGEDQSRSSFSTYGRFVDFVTPGESITSLYTADRYADWSGTSFSSPLAASVASLVLTANPDLSPAQVVKILRETATDLGKEGRDIEYGRGMLNAEAAVLLALDTKGKWAKRNLSAGTSPWIDNDWSDLAGLIRSLDTGDGTLAISQGFVTLTDDGTIASVIGHETHYAVPEPASFLLLMAGIMLTLHHRRARR